MEKFKNLYGDAGTSRKLGIKKPIVKRKKQKKDMKKSLKKYGDSLAEFLINTIDLAGQVPKNERGNSLKKVTNTVLTKISKNQRKKRFRSKSPIINNVDSETSEEECFDEDMQLSSLIQINLMRKGYPVKSKSTKTRSKKAPDSSDSEFDADRELESLLRGKLLKTEKIPASDLSSPVCVNDEKTTQEGETFHSSDDTEKNRSSGSIEEDYIPGKFVLLKPQVEENNELDNQSIEYSMESNESNEKQNPAKSAQEEQNEVSLEENKTEEKVIIENHMDTIGSINSTYDKIPQEMVIIDGDIYDDDLGNYDPSNQTMEDMLYDSVFEPTSTIDIQPNDTEKSNVLKEYSMMQNVTIEPLKQTPVVNGIVHKESTPQTAIEKTTEDVVEILSSDDDEEPKPVEKKEPETVTNNHVAEEISDGVFNNLRFYKAGQHIVVVLKHPTRLYFWGKLLATSLFGNVCVLGCNLQNSIPYPIYSPCGLGKIYFETVQCENTFNPMSLFPKLEKTSLSTFDTEQIVTSVGEHDAVIYLQNNNTVLTRFLNLLFTNPKLFPTARRPPNQNDGDYKTTLQTFFYKQEECNNGVNIGESWFGISNYAFTKMFNAKILVCGGKGVGKSTLNRFLVNSHVNNTPVIYVDLDVGQPEFGISGTISATKVSEPVFGPSYTHTRTKFLKMRYVCNIDVMENMNLYLNTVKKMMEELWEEYSELPWVINTMGFVKTFGESINVVIIRMTKPSFVIQIHDKEHKNNYQSYMRPELVHNYEHGLEIELPEPFNFEHMLIMTETNTKNKSLEPKQVRDLNIMSYFSNLLNEDLLYLSEVVPQMAPVSCLKIWTTETITPNLILKSLNGCLVALCQVEPDIPTNSQDGLQIISNKFDVGPVCLGFGIVRGVSESKEIYVLTPLKSSGLRDVNCIANCCQTLPTNLFTKNCPNNINHAPYVTLKRDRPITSKVPKRNFHLQRSRTSGNGINGKQM